MVLAMHGGFAFLERLRCAEQRFSAPFQSSFFAGPGACVPRSRDGDETPRYAGGRFIWHDVGCELT